MGTTKKTVARSTTKKAPAKKVVKKVAKKTAAAKKPAAKKTPAKKSKSVAKKTPKSTKAPKNTKTKKTTKAARKTPKSPAKPQKTLKPKPKDTLPKSDKKIFTLGFPQSFSLSVLMVPRLPVDTDALAIGMARYGGMAFIFLGFVFTYWHAAALNLAPHNLMATSIAAQLETSDTTVSVSEKYSSSGSGYQTTAGPDRTESQQLSGILLLASAFVAALGTALVLLAGYFRPSSRPKRQVTQSESEVVSVAQS